jgi:hypothetical protein
VPSPTSVTEPIISPASFEERATGSPGTPAPELSVTVTVAVVIEVPSATMLDGESERLMAVAGPAA